MKKEFCKKLVQINDFYKSKRTDVFMEVKERDWNEIKKHVSFMATEDPTENCWGLLRACNECALRGECLAESLSCPYERARILQGVIERIEKCD